MENKETGRSKPAFRWYTITLTSEEIGKIQAEHLAAKAALEKARKTKKHRPLPYAPSGCAGGVSGSRSANRGSMTPSGKNSNPRLG